MSALERLIRKTDPVESSTPLEATVSCSNPLQVTVDEFGPDTAYTVRWQRPYGLPTGDVPPVGTPCLVVLTELSCWLLAFEGWPV